jgi:hypothetical protein
MHDALTAVLFILMLIGPCLITMDGGKKKKKK